MKISSYFEELKQIRAELSSENYEEPFINQATVAILKERGKDRRAKSLNKSRRNSWRNDPATDKQLKLLDRFNVNYDDNITKGKASQLIKYRISNESDQEEWMIE